MRRYALPVRQLLLAVAALLCVMLSSILSTTKHEYCERNRPVITARNCPQVNSNCSQLTINPSVLARADTIEMSERVFTYETPFLDKKAADLPIFRKLPMAESMIVRATETILEFWVQISKYTEFYEHINNDMFNMCDGAILYSAVRHLKPRRVFEIGAGFSTRAVSQALTAVEKDTGVKTRHVCIEPYRPSVLAGLGVEVVEELIQHVDLALFNELHSGDLLFLDNSHVIRPYGDVLFELLWLLPRLQPGVYVHLHDIYLPGDYPTHWMHVEMRAYTEQYLLAAFLYNNAEWEVTFINNGFLAALPGAHQSSYSAVCSSHGGSIYLRKKVTQQRLNVKHPLNHQ